MRQPICVAASIAFAAASIYAKTEWSAVERDRGIQYRWEATSTHPEGCAVEFRDQNLRSGGTDFMAVISYHAGSGAEHSISRFIRITGDKEGEYGSTTLQGICDTVTGVSVRFVNR